MWLKIAFSRPQLFYLGDKNNVIKRLFTWVTSSYDVGLEEIEGASLGMSCCWAADVFSWLVLSLVMIGSEEQWGLVGVEESCTGEEPGSPDPAPLTMMTSSSVMTIGRGLMPVQRSQNTVAIAIERSWARGTGDTWSRGRLPGVGRGQGPLLRRVRRPPLPGTGGPCLEASHWAPSITASLTAPVRGWCCGGCACSAAAAVAAVVAIVAAAVAVGTGGWAAAFSAPGPAVPRPNWWVLAFMARKHCGWGWDPCNDHESHVTSTSLCVRRLIRSS